MVLCSKPLGGSMIDPAFHSQHQWNDDFVFKVTIFLITSLPWGRRTASAKRGYKVFKIFFWKKKKKFFFKKWSIVSLLIILENELVTIFLDFKELFGVCSLNFLLIYGHNYMW